MKTYYKHIILWGLLSLSLALPAGNYVIINQVMYDSPLNEVVAYPPYSNGEFIELYNGSDSQVSLQGWHLSGDSQTEDYYFQNVSIPSHGFLVIAYRHTSTPSFTIDSLFSPLINNSPVSVIYQSAIVMANTGETITLYNNGDSIVDQIYYDGTSHLSKPDRLSAENADNIPGCQCVSLHRTWVEFDAEGKVVQDLAYSYIGNTPDICVCDIDGNGNPWIGVDRGLYRLIPKNGKLIREEISPLLRPLFGLYITDILKRGNAVWITTNEGLFRYDPFSRQLNKYQHQADVPGTLSHIFLSSLALTSDNTLLVGSLNGVNVYDDKNDNFTVWNSASQPPLKNDFIHCLMVDKGLIYIGTEAGGIIRLAPQQLLLQNSIHTSDPGSLSPNPVNAMYVEPDGTLWVGTVEGGLNSRMRGEKSFTHFTKYNSGLPHNSVSALAADKYGHLWVGTWGGGICLLDMKSPQRFFYPKMTEEQMRLTNFVGALAYDPINNGMWIGSNDGMFFYNYICPLFFCAVINYFCKSFKIYIMSCVRTYIFELRRQFKHCYVI